MSHYTSPYMRSNYNAGWYTSSSASCIILVYTVFMHIATMKVCSYQPHHLATNAHYLTSILSRQLN